MEDRGWRMEDGGWRIEDRGWRMEDRGWRMEDGGWRMEDGGWRMEDGGWRMEDGGWRMEDGAPSTFYLLSSTLLIPTACCGTSKHSVAACREGSLREAVSGAACGRETTPQRSRP